MYTIYVTQPQTAWHPAVPQWFGGDGEQQDGASQTFTSLRQGGSQGVNKTYDQDGQGSLQDGGDDAAATVIEEQEPQQRAQQQHTESAFQPEQVSVREPHPVR